MTDREAPVLVSVITPTRNRDTCLRKTLNHFRSQDYKNIEWRILDDSPHPTKFLHNIDDTNVFYHHVCAGLTLGEKRNTLIEMARGEIIVQFDDDDYYGPCYVSSMATNLINMNADLINLRGWFLYDLRSKFFGYWDLMRKEGLHNCCDRTGVTPIMFNKKNNGGLVNNHLGFGFSYVFKRKVWEAIKFPNINWNEDGEFSLKARSQFKLNGVRDTTGSCLHFLHRVSTSRCFPQFQIR